MYLLEIKSLSYERINYFNFSWHINYPNGDYASFNIYLRTYCRQPDIFHIFESILLSYMKEIYRFPGHWILTYVLRT